MKKMEENLIFHNAPATDGLWILNPDVRTSEPTYMNNKPRLQLYF